MRSAAVLLLTVTLAACGAPEVSVPDLPFDVPDRWTGGETAQGDPPADWWTRFGDADLIRYVSEGLKKNQNLRAAAARIEAAAAQARIAGADVYPRLDLSGNGSRSVQNLIGFPLPGAEDAVLTSRSTTYGLSLGLSWEIDLWGRVRAGESAALADVQAQEADFVGARLSLIGRTCKAYFSAVEARRQVALSRATVENYRNTAERVRERYKRGLRPSIDVRLTQANLAVAESVLELRLEQLARVLRQLETLLGRYPSGTLRVASDLPGVPGPVPAGLPAELISRRPDLVAAERRLAAGLARVDQAEASLYPRISLTASGGTSSNELSDLLDRDFSIWSILGGIVEPLFYGWKLAAAVDLAEANADQGRALFLDRALLAYSEVESTLAAESRLARRQEALEEAADEARAAAQISEERYGTGVGDLITLLDAQRRAFDAESQLLTVRRLRLDARIDLHLALGGGFQIKKVNQENR